MKKMLPHVCKLYSHQVRLLGIDRDAMALQAAKQRLAIYQERLSLRWLSEMKAWMFGIQKGTC